MTPGNIIRRAEEKKLDVIAITDHNSAGNVEVAVQLARGTSVTVLPGLEVETKEEVHTLCLFSQVEEALQLQELIYDRLPNLKNREDVFGYQILTDLNDEYEKKVERMLAGAADIALEQLVKEVKSLGGVAIPAHINRVNGLLNQLGFIPPNLELAILEIGSKAELVQLQKQYPDHVFIKNGDSHYLKELKAGFELKLTKPSLKEIKATLIGRKGRKLIL